MLKPRSESVIQLDVKNDLKFGITPELQISDGVYLARSVVKVENKRAITTVLNTTHKTVNIHRINLVLDEISPPPKPVLNVQSETNNKTLSNERLKLLKENLRLDHLNEKERNGILKLCTKYHAIFHLPGDSLPYTDLVQHEIPVTDRNPIKSKLYRPPQRHYEEIKRQTDEMLPQKIIRHSNSPYSSPILMVPKKSDASGQTKWRLCVDYRALNKVTIGDAYPLPSISTILDNLGYSKFFTVLDVSSAFHLVKIRPEDIAKTAYTTPFGHFEWLRMSFGLKTACATQQRLMDRLLMGLQGSQCFVYLDDVVLANSSWEDHEKQIEEPLFYDRDLLIFSIKIPLVTGIKFNFYHLLPLPAFTEHQTVISIIDTQYPYLLINAARTRYCQIRERTGCTRTADGEFICENLVTYSTAQNPVCATRLLASPPTVPEDCLTHTLKANLEIWHPIQPDTWLFTITSPTPASISCEDDPNHILDVSINGSGLMTLQPRCQLYTYSTTLTSASNYSSNVTNFIPKFNISLDNCCVYKSQFLGREPRLMKPISITGLNMEELRHTKHKLDQFQETLEATINKPHIVSHSILYQFYVAFTILLLALIMAYIFCCKCCNFRWLPIFGRLWPESNRNAPVDLSKICITNINLTRNRTPRSHYNDSDEEFERVELSSTRPVITSRRSNTRSQGIRT
ncbi:uncharacterized protein [Bemisia tabaci]|uniref:uncharacterized protein n=1 Tax=Bemisia tabaci TaxID=7038 RepID=UPI003B27CD0B